jgi:hypothetical protein
MKGIGRWSPLLSGGGSYQSGANIAKERCARNARLLYYRHESRAMMNMYSLNLYEEGRPSCIFRKERPYCECTGMTGDALNSLTKYKYDFYLRAIIQNARLF